LLHSEALVTIGADAAELDADAEEKAPTA